MNKVILGLRNRLYDLDPEWGFDPAPSVNQARPIISDYLVDNLSRGLITSKPPIDKVLDSHKISHIVNMAFECKNFFPDSIN